MSESDSPLRLRAVSPEQDDGQPRTIDATPRTTAPSNAAPEREDLPSVLLPRSAVQHSRRYSTQMSFGVVYPIEEATGGMVNPPLANGRRRSVSTRGIAGAPASTPATWATLSSSLRRSVSDIRGHTEGLNGVAINSPKETPYEEMMARFQIRQLQRTPSSITVGLEGDFAAPPSSGLTARAPVDPHQEHRLHPRLSARNVSDHVSSMPDLGQRTGSFLDFGDRSSLIGGGHPPLESGTSSVQLTEQFNLAHGSLPQRDTRASDSVVASIQRTLHVWERRLVKPISPYSAISQARYAIIFVATVCYVLWFPLELAFPSKGQHVHVDKIVGVLLGLDVLITLRSSFLVETGAVVVSNWCIMLHYVKTRLLIDLLIAVSLLEHVNPNHFGGKWVSFVLGGLSVERLAYITRFVRMIWFVRANQSGSGNNFWAWVLYSRYSHLFRIAGIVAMVMCIAHYIACIWTILLDEADAFENTMTSWQDKYSESFYSALLLMQGEGVPTETAAQNLFASLSVVLGSIVLAVVFGHVAILVSNFNANTTSYQRKMEEVFAMTTKLQLPAPLRERIREYYEHLWHEYECLDGEIVQFSKDLSHSLGLEVVLFKYMEVVMNIPFWKDCTPDFQKQLMLNLDVRVYLPNDFIMRQGEVDDEFYMINRGYCELDRDVSKFERVTTTTLATGRNGFKIGRSNSGMTGRRRTVAMSGGKMDDEHRQSAYELDAAQRNYYRNGGRGGKGHEVLISRGQAFGDMALLMNYERAANVRAITHVEMCVLSRDSFQTVLSKYPEDRHRVVVDMIASYMQSYEVSKARCPMLELVRQVYSPEEITKACGKAGAPDPLLPQTLTVRQAAERIYTAINLESNDATLKFGVGVNIRDKLVNLRERRRKKRAMKRQSKRSDSSSTASTTASCYDDGSSKSHLNSGDCHRKAAGSGTGSVMVEETAGAPGCQALPEVVPTLSLQERLHQLEERELAILQGLKDLQASFKILRSRQTTAPVLPSRKRSAPGDDIAIGRSTRMPLLRRVGSFVGMSSGFRLDSNTQGLTEKKSPTRYSDKFFDQQASVAHLQQSKMRRNYPMEQQTRHHNVEESSRTKDSFRFTSDIEPQHSAIESSLVDEQQPDVVATSNSRSRNSEQQLAAFQPSKEVAQLGQNRQMLFQRMASRSVRVLEGTIQTRMESSPAAKATRTVEARRSTFQRTHSQSLRTMAEDFSASHLPRSSLTSAQAHVLNRMSSFVAESNGQRNNKRSPTRYADELFRRSSTDSPKEEGWAPK